MDSAVIDALDGIIAATSAQDWSTIDAELAVVRAHSNDLLDRPIGNSYAITLGVFLPQLVEFRSRPDLTLLGAAATQLEVTLAG